MNRLHTAPFLGKGLLRAVGWKKRRKLSNLDCFLLCHPRHVCVKSVCRRTQIKKPIFVFFSAKKISLRHWLLSKENGKVNRESYYTFSFENPPHSPFHISGRFICTRLFGVLICCEIFNEFLCSNVLPSTPLFIVFTFSSKVYRLWGWGGDVLETIIW